MRERWQRGERGRENMRSERASEGILKAAYEEDKKRYKQVGSRGSFSALPKQHELLISPHLHG